MKLIGLLGGMSWSSTIPYYEILNRAAQEKFGASHSARILLYSVDYHPIKSLYIGNRDKIPAVLEQEIKFVLDKKPDCLVICCHTMHKYLDIFAHKLDKSVPIFHAGRLAADEATGMGCKKVLLLGTAFTMEDGFFAKYFQDKNIDVILPKADDRKIIQDAQSELAKGVNGAAYHDTFAKLLAGYADVDAIILACTELPLAINSSNAPRPIINPIESQCRAAAQFAFG